MLGQKASVHIKNLSWQLYKGALHEAVSKAVEETIVLEQNRGKGSDKEAWTSSLVMKYKYWKLLRIIA